MRHVRAVSSHEQGRRVAREREGAIVHVSVREGWASRASETAGGDQDEAKGGGGPILPKFNRPVRSAPAPAPEVPPEDLPAVIDKDGNPYVDAG
jgi:hypothetical protein